MDIKVTYKDRDLKFNSDSYRGSGIRELLEFTKKNKGKIDHLEITGESNSYTFLRQIYLLTNILSQISDIKIKIDGYKVKADKIILPVYKN